MRRILVLLALAASACLAQTPDERLAATARLWNYVKYVHPRVTAPGIDWDAAFAKAIPKISAAKSDDDFAAALNEMLGALHDPATRVTVAALSQDSRIVLTIKPAENGVTVVTLEAGEVPQAIQAMNGFAARIANAGNVVFDLRGSLLAPGLIRTLPVARACEGPSYASREHSGYANAGNSGSGGYSSSWKIGDAAQLPAASQAIRPVLLVNSKTAVPQVALVAQQCGAGAIVSEDAITEDAVDVAQVVPGFGKLRVKVRTRELWYPDGTTGFSPNVVLDKTGDDALRAAMELARSGNWPVPKDRPRRTLPPAIFTEKNYIGQPYPSMEYRVIAAARVWGVFHYFHPYLPLYGEDWDKVLLDFIPRMARAEDALQYHLAVAEMVAHTHDSHSSVSSRELNDFRGRAAAGLELQWIDNQPVVLRVVDPTLKDAVHPGDIVKRIDGAPPSKAIGELSPFVSASTPQSLMNTMMRGLLSGPPDTAVSVTFASAAGEREVQVPRNPANARLLSPYRSGDVFRLATPKIGYVDLERLTTAQVDEMFEKFKNTDAIIMDMRGYPQGTAWSIAPRLANQPGKIDAVFRRNLVTAEINPDRANQVMLFEQPIPVTTKPLYSGKTVMLIDERAISQSEHSGLMYKTANGTVFIGSPTQGANGDVTWFMAPGGIRINFSGHDVRWPDGRQLQRVGLTPDIPVRPTPEGIRAGRDEVLERAIEYLEKGR